MRRALHHPAQRIYFLARPDERRQNRLRLLELDHRRSRTKRPRAICRRAACRIGACCARGECSPRRCECCHCGSRLRAADFRIASRFYAGNDLSPAGKACRFIWTSVPNAAYAGSDRGGCKLFFACASGPRNFRCSGVNSGDKCSGCSGGFTAGRACTSAFSRPCGFSAHGKARSGSNSVAFRFRHSCGVRVRGTGSRFNACSGRQRSTCGSCAFAAFLIFTCTGASARRHGTSGFRVIHGLAKLRSRAARTTVPHNASANASSSSFQHSGRDSCARSRRARSRSAASAGGRATCA